MKELKILPNTIVFEGLDGAGTTTQRNKQIGRASCRERV